jgi:hypothetical protein
MSPRPLRCTRARRPGPHILRRTGRTQPTSDTRYLDRLLPRQHEYLCTCGYTGVSGSPEVLGLHSLAESRWPGT